MARNQTLESLLTDLRVEARLSLNPAHNVQQRDSQVALLQREQRRLWEDYAWPFLRVHRFIPLAAGQRLYDMAAAFNEAGDDATDLSPHRIEYIEIKSDGEWLPMYPGVTARQYAAHDSFLDERAWAPRRWDLTENDEIEIWPVPDQSAGDPSDSQYGTLRVTGIRNLRPLVSESDRTDLDGTLIVLFVAGAILAASGAKDASLKIEAANRLYGRLKNNGAKGGSFNMFNTTVRPARQRPFISRYRPPV